MALKIYDPDLVSVNVMGIPITGGYADGEFLSIEYESDAFSDVVGTDGEVTRSKSNDRRATVTLTLMQTADANDQLSGVAVTDREAANGAGVGALFIRDQQGNSIYEAAECWISKTPAATFDREATSREWTIRVARLEDFTGGT